MGVEVLKINVVGESYYKSEIASIGLENDDYHATKKQLLADYEEGDTIWEYDFPPMFAQVIPEPDNPHDSNAIKVVVGGVQVGHIARKDQAKVTPFIDRGDIEWTAYISGGPHKTLVEGDDGKIQINSENHDFSVRIVAELMAKIEPKEAAAPQVKTLDSARVAAKVSDRNFTATLLFAIFLGGFGAHRFYAGKTGTAILWLFTGGFGAIGWIIDVATILSNTFTDWSGAYILSEAAQKQLKERGEIPTQGTLCYVLSWVFVGLAILTLAFEIFAGFTTGLHGFALFWVILGVIYCGAVAWILAGKSDAAVA